MTAAPHRKEPAIESSLAGRVAIVTGGSRGIGRAVAGSLALRGCKLCITGRKEADLASAVEELSQVTETIAVQGSVEDSDHRTSALDTVRDVFGGADILINNAATSPVFGEVADVDPVVAERILRINFLAPLAWCQELIATFSREPLSIVNVASLAGLTPTRGLGVYGASKAALIQISRQLALEHGPRVRVNSVAPAVIMTDLVAARYEKDPSLEQTKASGYPLGRLGKAEDVASAVSFLVSDTSRWITGQSIVVDGGVSLNVPI